MPTNSSHELWNWQRFLVALDKAGYRIVEKPKLTDKGLPRKPGG